MNIQMLSKSLACIIILLFLALSWAPGIYAQDNTVSSPTTNFTSKDTVPSAEVSGEAKTLEKEVKEIEQKTEETKGILKEKEEVAKAAQKEAEEITKEKEAIAKELQEKEAAVAVAKEESEALKKEAEITKDADALKKAKELSAEARRLEKEADLHKDKLKAAESKQEVAQQKVGAYQTSIDSLKKELEELKKTRATKRTLKEKLIISGVIIFVGIVVFVLLKLIMRLFERSITKKDVLREDEITLRMRTTSKLVNWLGGFVIIGAVIYAVLEVNGISVGPLIAGAGIMGLAFGFGGQYLIRDLINGLFILLEGQYRINDVVKIGEYGGLVEDINLRITTLRDLEGRVIIIPNGEVKTVVNYTREYAQALLDIGVAYKENVDQVMTVIKDVCAAMRKDSYFSRLILGDVEMFGVDDFGDSQVTIKFRVKTLPIKQWEVMRELRRRIKNRFDELGIEIPFPHRTVYWGTGQDNEWVKNFADRMVPRNQT